MMKTAEGESQQRSQGRKKWSETMKKDLLECKRKALLLANAKELPRSNNGWKQGYMKIMKDLWEEKAYADVIKQQSWKSRWAM